MKICNILTLGGEVTVEVHELIKCELYFERVKILFLHTYKKSSFIIVLID